MRSLLILSCFLTFQCEVFAQSADDIIRQVKDAQNKVKTVSCEMYRTDTLLTGHTRHMSGHAVLQAAAANVDFGAKFKAKQDSIAEESIYDGEKGILVDHQKKQYSIVTNTSMGFLYNGGAQIVLPDVVKLDTTGAIRFAVKQDDSCYYLTMYMADLTQYDVTNRFKVFTISKKTKLPVGLRQHQETLGKVQDLTYKVTRMRIDDKKDIDATQLNIPNGYKLLENKPGADKPRISALINKPALPFTLASVIGDSVVYNGSKGKVILLDFLEVWCGPCFESVPKVQAVYEKYKQRGLEVYAMTFDKGQDEPMKKMIAKFNISFPVLKANDTVKEFYATGAIPRYVVIDRKGNISADMIGFSGKIEQEIERCLAE